jgi:hypothetical protein
MPIKSIFAIARNTLQNDREGIWLDNTQRKNAGRRAQHISIRLMTRYGILAVPFRHGCARIAAVQSSPFVSHGPGRQDVE